MAPSSCPEWDQGQALCLLRCIQALEQGLQARPWVAMTEKDGEDGEQQKQQEQRHSDEECCSDEGSVY